MFKKFIEFPLHINYVSSWGLWEGLQELAQNTIDQSNYSSKNYSITYERNKSEIQFVNFNSKLNISSLLLGLSTKTDCNKTVGKFGEGFKLAFLCLTRLSRFVKVYNQDEIWTPFFKYSDKFGTEILHVSIEKNTNPSNNLVFVVQNISHKDFELFKEHFLLLEYPENIIKTENGNLLLDKKFSKKLFVNGLFVNYIQHDDCKYGYDLLPEYVPLDRDRKTIDTFNLFINTARVFNSLSREHFPFLKKAIDDNIAEIQDLKYFDINADFINDIGSVSHKEFLDKYGKTAVPVKSQIEADIIKKNYNSLVPVILDTIKYKVITGSEHYKNSFSFKVTQKTELTPYKFIKNFIEKNKRYIYGTHKKLIEEKLLTQAKLWQYRK